jgi:hypothetical protein
MQTHGHVDMQHSLLQQQNSQPLACWSLEYIATLVEQGSELLVAAEEELGRAKVQTVFLSLEHEDLREDSFQLIVVVPLLVVVQIQVFFPSAEPEHQELRAVSFQQTVVAMLFEVENLPSLLCRSTLHHIALLSWMQT